MEVEDLFPPEAAGLLRTFVACFLDCVWGKKKEKKKKKEKVSDTGVNSLKQG